MPGNIKLMRANVHKSDNGLFINDECRRASDVVGINSQPVIDTVAFDHFPLFINQQGEGNVMTLGVPTDFAGPLANDSEHGRPKCGVFVKMSLQVRQLAAAIGSPCTAKEDQNNVTFALIRLKTNFILMCRTQCE